MPGRGNNVGSCVGNVRVGRTVWVSVTVLVLTEGGAVVVSVAGSNVVDGAWVVSAGASVADGDSVTVCVPSGAGPGATESRGFVLMTMPP